MHEQSCLPSLFPLSKQILDFRSVSMTTVCIIIFIHINMQIYLWLFSTFSYICTPDINTGDYSSFSFLLDTLCLLVLIIDNIKLKAKGDYSSWVSNHKLFYHYPLYSNNHFCSLRFFLPFIQLLTIPSIFRLSAKQFWVH